MRNQYASCICYLWLKNSSVVVSFDDFGFILHTADRFDSLIKKNMKELKKERYKGFYNYNNVTVPAEELASGEQTFQPNDEDFVDKDEASDIAQDMYDLRNPVPPRDRIIGTSNNHNEDDADDFEILDWNHSSSSSSIDDDTDDIAQDMPDDNADAEKWLKLHSIDFLKDVKRRLENLMPFAFFSSDDKSIHCHVPLLPQCLSALPQSLKKKMRLANSNDISNDINFYKSSISCNELWNARENIVNILSKHENEADSSSDNNISNEHDVKALTEIISSIAKQKIQLVKHRIDAQRKCCDEIKLKLLSDLSRIFATISPKQNIAMDSDSHAVDLDKEIRLPYSMISNINALVKHWQNIAMESDSHVADREKEIMSHVMSVIMDSDLDKIGFDDHSEISLSGQIYQEYTGENLLNVKKNDILLSVEQFSKKFSESVEVLAEESKLIAGLEEELKIHDSNNARYAKLSCDIFALSDTIANFYPDLRICYDDGKIKLSNVAHPEEFEFSTCNIGIFNEVLLKKSSKKNGFRGNSNGAEDWEDVMKHYFDLCQDKREQLTSSNEAENVAIRDNVAGQLLCSGGSYLNSLQDASLRSRVNDLHAQLDGEEYDAVAGAIANIDTDRDSIMKLFMRFSTHRGIGVARLANDNVHSPGFMNKEDAIDSTVLSYLKRFVETRLVAYIKVLENLIYGRSLSFDEWQDLEQYELKKEMKAVSFKLQKLSKLKLDPNMRNALLHAILADAQSFASSATKFFDHWDTVAMYNGYLSCRIMDSSIQERHNIIGDDEDFVAKYHELCSNFNANALRNESHLASMNYDRTDDKSLSDLLLPMRHVAIDRYNNNLVTSEINNAISNDFSKFTKFAFAQKSHEKLCNKMVEKLRKLYPMANIAVNKGNIVVALKRVNKYLYIDRAHMLNMLNEDRLGGDHDVACDRIVNELTDLSACYKLSHAAYEKRAAKCEDKSFGKLEKELIIERGNFADMKRCISAAEIVATSSADKGKIKGMKQYLDILFDQLADMKGQYFCATDLISDKKRGYYPIRDLLLDVRHTSFANLSKAIKKVKKRTNITYDALYYDDISRSLREILHAFTAVYLYAGEKQSESNEEEADIKEFHAMQLRDLILSAMREMSDMRDAIDRGACIDGENNIKLLDMLNNAHHKISDVLNKGPHLIRESAHIVDVDCNAVKKFKDLIKEQIIVENKIRYHSANASSQVIADLVRESRFEFIEKEAKFFATFYKSSDAVVQLIDEAIDISNSLENTKYYANSMIEGGAHLRNSAKYLKSVKKELSDLTDVCLENYYMALLRSFALGINRTEEHVSIETKMLVNDLIAFKKETLPEIKEKIYNDIDRKVYDIFNIADKCAEHGSNILGFESIYAKHRVLYRLMCAMKNIASSAKRNLLHPIRRMSSWLICQLNCAKTLEEIDYDCNACNAASDKQTANTSSLDMAECGARSLISEAEKELDKWSSISLGSLSSEYQSKSSSECDTNSNRSKSFAILESMPGCYDAISIQSIQSTIEELEEDDCNNAACVAHSGDEQIANTPPLDMTEFDARYLANKAKKEINEWLSNSKESLHWRRPKFANKSSQVSEKDLIENNFDNKLKYWQRNEVNSAANNVASSGAPLRNVEKKFTFDL